MFSRFFKPRWQHPDRNIRLAAISHLNEHNPRHRDALKTLALTDSDAGIRAAALKQITQRATLEQWLPTLDHEQQATLRQYLQQLLNNEIAATNDTNQRAQLLANLESETLVALLQTASDRQLREQALTYLRHEQDFFSVALQAKTADTRLAAAQQLPLSSLKALQAQSRDKALQRFCRDRLKTLQAEEKVFQEKRERVQTLLEALQQHSQRPFDNLYNPRLDQLILEWQKNNDVSSEQEIADAKQAVAACYAVINAHQEGQELAQLREQAQRELQDSVQTLKETFAQLAELDEWPPLGGLQVVFDTQQRRWAAASEFRQAEPALAKHFAAISQQWQALLAALLAHEENPELWPTSLPTPPALRNAQQPPTANELPGSAPQSVAPNKEQYDVAHSLMNKLQNALRRRQLRPANALMKRLLALTVALPEPQQRRLEKLQQEWQELQDWQSFAAVPKKEQLCQDMEQLIGLEDDPQSLANRIQALQEEWRQLGAGHDDEQQALWERFKEASDKAYAPCREFYQAQDALKADNLAKRQALCQQLEDYLAQIDWQQFNDWPGLLDIRRTAGAEWKRYQPVKFVDSKAANQHFDRLLKTLDEKLDGISEQHSHHAQQLIEQAAALLEGTPDKTRTDTFKTLQQQWRQLGWIHPRHYRALHKKFRALADQYFALNKQAQQANREQQQQQKAHLQQQLEAADQLLQANPAEQEAAPVQELLNTLRQLPCHEPALKTRLNKTVRRLAARLQQLPLWQQWQALQQLPATDTDTAAQQELCISLEVSLSLDSPEHARAARTQWQLEQLTQARRLSQDEPITILAHHLEALAALQQRPSTDTSSRFQRALSTLESAS